MREILVALDRDQHTHKSYQRVLNIDFDEERMLDLVYMIRLS
jgi:hypothetical protein